MAAKRDRRMALYIQGLTDTDIADKIGLTRSGVRSWRRRFGLPSNAKRGRPGGVPMSEALTLEQQEVARLGLRIISTGYNNGLSIGAALAAARVYIGDGRTNSGKFKDELAW